MISIEVLKRHTCHPAGAHWIWRGTPGSAQLHLVWFHEGGWVMLSCILGCDNGAFGESVACILLPIPLSSDCLNWQLYAKCKLSQVPDVTSGSHSGCWCYGGDMARNVFGSFNRLRAEGCEPCGQTERGKGGFK